MCSAIFVFSALFIAYIASPKNALAQPDLEEIVKNVLKARELTAQYEKTKSVSDRNALIQKCKEAAKQAFNAAEGNYNYRKFCLASGAGLMGAAIQHLFESKQYTEVYSFINNGSSYRTDNYISKLPEPQYMPEKIAWQNYGSWTRDEYGKSYSMINAYAVLTMSELKKQDEEQIKYAKNALAARLLTDEHKLVMNYAIIYAGEQKGKYDDIKTALKNCNEIWSSTSLLNTDFHKGHVYFIDSALFRKSFAIGSLPSFDPDGKLKFGVAKALYKAGIYELAETRAWQAQTGGYKGYDVYWLRGDIARVTKNTFKAEKLANDVMLYAVLGQLNNTELEQLAQLYEYAGSKSKAAEARKLKK